MVFLIKNAAVSQKYKALLIHTLDFHLNLSLLLHIPSTIVVSLTARYMLEYEFILHEYPTASAWTGHTATLNNIKKDSRDVASH